MLSIALITALSLTVGLVAGLLLRAIYEARRYDPTRS